MNNPNYLVYGQPDPPPSPLPLRAGPLHLLYEPGTSFVRRIRLGGREVLRGIYAAVRDRNWDTLPGALRETRREIEADSFFIEFESEHRRLEVHFVWRGSVRGENGGVLRYTFDGEARSTFQRNRLGFCVLHPIRECAGAAARQLRDDGRLVECRFPETIERQIFGQSSFHDLRAVAHEVAPGLWAEVEFEGDVFEMEDQRNWTDASFKTYCTPLALPFPVEVPAGTRIRQSVTLRLVGAGAVAGRGQAQVIGGSPGPVTITVPGKAESPLPLIGLGAASHDDPLTEREVARLRLLRLSHLRFDLRLSSPRWPDHWARAEREAGQLGVGLELALHLPRSGDPDLTGVRRRLRADHAQVSRVLALREGEAATTPGTLALVREAVRDLPAPVGGGSDANFCELNREQTLGHFPLTEADFVFWSINPQVHAFDSLSLLETLEAQPETVKTARAFAGGKPFVISPVTLKQRLNPVAAGTPPPVPPADLPPQVDPRQLSLFCGAWTLGSLVALAGAGAASVTYYETTGWRGVTETEAGSLLPGVFPSCPGDVFPVFHLFAALADFRRTASVPCDPPGTVAALCLFHEKARRRLLLANLTGQALTVRLRTEAESAHVRVLDATNVRQAMREPGEFLALPTQGLSLGAEWMALSISAHALACLDFG